MSLYEHVFITRQDISSQQVEQMADDLKVFLEDNDAKITKTESWGLRNLAYPIKKNRKGHYMLLCLEAPGALIEELERRQRLHEDVMRYMTVHVEAFNEAPSPVLARKEERRRRPDGPPPHFSSREGGRSKEGEGSSRPDHTVSSSEKKEV